MSPSVLAPAIQALRQQREECVQRLRKSEDYQALLSLDRALKALEQKDDGGGSFANDMFAMPAPWQRERISQSNAAFLVLREHGSMPVAELVPLVQARGAVVGGDEPAVNLSSSLSRDGRFKSFRDANGLYRWTLKTPIEAKPSGNTDNGGTTGADTPAAEDAFS